MTLTPDQAGQVAAVVQSTIEKETPWGASVWQPADRQDKSVKVGWARVYVQNKDKSDARGKPLQYGFVYVDRDGFCHTDQLMAKVAPAIIKALEEEKSLGLYDGNGDDALGGDDGGPF